MSGVLNILPCLLLVVPRSSRVVVAASTIFLKSGHFPLFDKSFCDGSFEIGNVGT